MDIVTRYLENGKLEALCLGLLSEDETKEILLMATNHPAISKRIIEIENTLKKACYIRPEEGSKAKMIEALNDISNETVTGMQDVPFIHRHSDAAEWNRLVKDLQPLHNGEALQLQEIKNTEAVEMYVTWLYNSLEEEGHDPEDFEESILVLEGSCECNLEGDMFYLTSGDYLSIPPKTGHIIKPTSDSIGYVKAILQRRKKVA